MNILLIEPDKILSSQYAEALNPSIVIWRRDAQSAILAIDKQKPDLIITELLMPKHSGIEFLYELRSYSEWQNIPVIILSRINQKNSGIDQAAIKKLGITKYLYKPETSLNKLIDVVSKNSLAKT